MANRNAIFGARLIGTLGSGNYNATVNSYIVPASDTTALGIGDFVKITGDGATNVYGQTFPTAIKAGVGEVLLGVIVSFLVDSNDLNHIYRAASTERTMLVCDDPTAIFEIQTNGVAIAGDFASNADIALGTLNTIFGTSGTQLDEASITAATAQLRILGLSQRIDNELGQYAKFKCMINEHIFKQGGGV